ncbi:hypothetical protein BTVI_120616 [Pitangus sulphuratus]|nr:hypothetical protein BTVI_120616 [Pitangus sulphuratus]
MTSLPQCPPASPTAAGNLGPSFRQPSAIRFGQTPRRCKLAGVAVMSKVSMSTCQNDMRQQMDADQEEYLDILGNGDWVPLALTSPAERSRGSGRTCRGPNRNFSESLPSNSTDVAKCHEVKLMKLLRVLVPGNSPDSVITLEQENIDACTKDVAISLAIDFFVQQNPPGLKWICPAASIELSKQPLIMAMGCAGQVSSVAHSMAMWNVAVFHATGIRTTGYWQSAPVLNELKHGFKHFSSYELLEATFLRF